MATAGEATLPGALLVAIHSAAPGGAQAMGLAESERFRGRCRIVAAVPEGPLTASFAEFAEVVSPAPPLPTWPASWARWALQLARSVVDAPRLARVIRRHRVEAVVTSSTVLLAPVLAARLAGVPAIVHAREWPISRSGRAVFALQRRLADVIVAISDGVAQLLAGPGRARLVRIADGIEVPPGDPRPARFGTPLRMCVVGSLTAVDGKGQHRAVETLAVLRDRGIDATLTIAGPVLDEAYAERVHSTARARDVADRVDFLGPCDDVHALLRDHDLLLFCSREGADVTPLVLMEALSEERPVVAAEVGSAREVVGDGELGEMVPAEDPEAMAEAVARLAADPASARAQAAEGRRHVLRNYDRAAGLERLWAVIIAEIEPTRAKGR
jgi:glycosyltransferase involved in cell wall biosynthesis